MEESSGALVSYLPVVSVVRRLYAGSYLGEPLTMFFTCARRELRDPVRFHS